LEVAKRRRIVVVGKWSALECLKPIDQNGEQRFVGEPIHANLANRTVLKSNQRSITQIARNVSVKSRHFIDMVRATTPRLVNRNNFQPIIRWVNLVTSDLSHLPSPLYSPMLYSAVPLTINALISLASPFARH
jgi:hypothetical protein